MFIIVGNIKDPKKRKEEFLNIAEELFITKGYENTSVNDIVEKAGVAKGLFYYYFKAKEDILNIIATKYIEYFVGKIEYISEREDKDAIEKIHQIFDTIISQFGIQRKGIKRLASLFNKENNMAIHSRMATKMVEAITPHVILIIKQGIRENLFKTEHPEFIAKTLLMWATLLHNTVEPPIASNSDNEAKAKAAEDMIEKILGAKKGSLDLYKYFKAIIDELYSL